MEIPKDTHTISMAGSTLSWDEIDRKAKERGMDRSKFVQRACEKEYYRWSIKENWETVSQTIILIFVMFTTVKVLML